MIRPPAKIVEGPISDQRATKRSKTFILAELLSDGSPKRVHVLNFSTTGALIHVGHHAPVSGDVTLRISGVGVKGSVVWSQAAVIGVRFNELVNIKFRDVIINSSHT